MITLGELTKILDPETNIFIMSEAEHKLKDNDRKRKLTIRRDCFKAEESGHLGDDAEVVKILNPQFFGTKLVTIIVVSGGTW